MAKKQKPGEGDTVDPMSPVIDLEAEDVRVIETEPVEVPEADPVVDEPSSAPPVVKKARRFPPRLAGGIALAALAALAGAWLYKDFGARFWPSDEMTALASRLSVIEAENKTLTDQLRGIAGTVDSLKESSNGFAEALKKTQGAADTAVVNSGAAQEVARALEGKLTAADARVTAAQKSIDALKAAMASVPASSTVPGEGISTAALADLQARLTTVEKDLLDLRTKAPTAGAEAATLLSQTLADLKAKVAAGAPYAAELQQISNLVPAAAGLTALAATTEKGVPTAQMLAAEAAALAEKLTPPPAVETVNEGSYWDSFIGMLGGLVKVRNIGETDWRAVAAQAGEAAQAGNLQEALELAKGEGEMPNELRVWREQVQARINAEAAIEEVSAAVLRQISAIGGAQ